MNGGFSELINQARAASPEPAAEDAVEEYASYAKLRGPRQVAFMLEFRLATGDGEAFDYGLLARATFDRSTGIVLHFAGAAVTITGKNLRPLYEAILTHRATWVAVAADPATAARDPEATVVTAIAADV